MTQNSILDQMIQKKMLKLSKLRILDGKNKSQMKLE